MQNKLLKRLLIVVGIIVVLATITTFIVPSLIDFNKYKPELAAQIEKATGYRTIISGDIKISVLPTITAKAMNIRLINPYLPGSRDILNARSLDASLELMPLLQGQTVIKSIELNQPEITLEINTQGRKNWDVEGRASNTETSTEAKPGKGMSLMVNEISITEGKINYRDLLKGKEYKASNIELTGNLGSLQGPFRVQGDLKFGELPVNVTAIIERLDPTQPIPAQIRVGLGGAEVSFEGSVAKKGEEVVLDGNFKAAAENIVPLLEQAGRKDLIAATTAKLNATSKVKYTNNLIELSGFDFQVGETAGKGDIRIDTSNGSDISGKMNFTRINLDELLRKDEEKKSDEPAQIAPPSRRLSMLLEMNADEVIYNTKIFKKFYIKTNVEGSDILVQPASVIMPGEANAEIYGLINTQTATPYFEGEISASGQNLRETLAGIGIPTEKVAAEKLKNFNFKSDIVVSQAQLSLSNMRMSFDQTDVSGEVRVRPGSTAAIGATIQLGKIDIDSYLPKEAEPEPQQGQGAPASRAKKVNFDWIRKFPADINLNAAADSITFGGEEYRRVVIQSSMAPNLVQLKRLSANTDKFSVAGTLNLDASKDRPRIEANLQLGDVDTAKFGAAEAKPSEAQNQAGALRWDNKPFNFSPLDQMDGKFQLNLQSLRHKKIVANNVQLAATLEGGQLSVEPLHAKLFGGDFAMNGNFNLGGVASLNVSFTLANFEMNEALTSLANLDKANGRMSISGVISGSGVSENSLIQGLQGAVAIAGRGVKIKGFDLQDFFSKVDNINKVTDLVALSRSASSGETDIRSIDGNFNIAKGVATTPGVVTDAGIAKGTARGNIDIYNWTIDMNTPLQLMMKGGELPTLGVRIYGPLDNPSMQPDLNDLQAWVARKVAGKVLGGQGGAILDNMRGGNVMNQGKQEIEGAVQKGAGKLRGLIGR